ncbi:hypothetical protein [Acidisoma sp. C75]
MPALACLAATQCWAGLSLRGLFADGAFYAAQIWLRHGYFIMEPARLTAQVLAQSPAALALHLGIGGPLAIAALFSLTTNLLPLALLALAAAALPVATRPWALVPLFLWLAFGMASSIASIGDGNTAAAYLWALFLLLLWGGAGWRPRLLALLLALGALRLYEANAFLAPLLALAGVWRYRQEGVGPGQRGPWPRRILGLIILLLLAAALISLHDLLFPRLPGNRASLLADVISCRWLWAEGRPNMPAWLGLLAVAVLPVAWLEGRARRWGWAVLGLAFAVGGALALWLQPVAAASFAARSNLCLVSGPAMLALLLARAWRVPVVEVARLVPLLSLLALSLALADARATLGWLGYTADMRLILAQGHGIIPWEQAMARLPSETARRNLRDFSWPWSTPLMSLWLAPRPGLASLIANPPGGGWQPFPPAILEPLLASASGSARPQIADGLRDAFPRAR